MAGLPARGTSAMRPLNFFRFSEPPFFFAIRSMVMKPALCRERAYSSPGLPRPATTHSIDERASDSDFLLDSRDERKAPNRRLRAAINCLMPAHGARAGLRVRAAPT